MSNIQIKFLITTIITISIAFIVYLVSLFKTDFSQKHILNPNDKFVVFNEYFNNSFLNTDFSEIFNRGEDYGGFVFTLFSFYLQDKPAKILITENERIQRKYNFFSVTSEPDEIHYLPVINYDSNHAIRLNVLGEILEDEKKSDTLRILKVKSNLFDIDVNEDNKSDILYTQKNLIPIGEIQFAFYKKRNYLHLLIGRKVNSNKIFEIKDYIKYIR